MSNSKASEFIQHLRRAMLLQDAAAMTDGQLLDCFLSQRDDAAFSALVRRHGSMVWGVCRRLLTHHDAEDAFQATFLVLVRKAASVEPKEMVANWLYGVAHQTALKARSVVARRKGRERQMGETPEPAVQEPEVWHDLQPLLDEELSRLPDKYRVPIVLCDLEGKTRKEAARQLGWPEGTVAGRLATARKMLARRLARRGVALSGGSMAAVLSHNAASACVPPSVLTSTIKVVTVYAAEQAAAGTVSIRVAVLTEGVLKSMLLTKLKITVTVLLVVAALSGAVGTIYRTQAEDDLKALNAIEKTKNKKAGEEGQTKAVRKQNKKAAEDEEKKAVVNPPPSKPAKKPRQLRWKIVFKNEDAHEYARQLEALGAKLAIPTKERNRYRLICDLSKRPVTTTIEDISKINRMVQWMDDDKESIQLLSKELGLKKVPEYIIVFLPRYVEDELLRRELDHAHRSEQDIEETTFTFSETKRGFDIKVASQR